MGLVERNAGLDQGVIRSDRDERTGAALTAAQRIAGEEFVRRWPTIDIHSHPGRFFMNRSPETPFSQRLGPPFIEASLSDIRQSGIGGVVFATVSDQALLDVSELGLQATREFYPGEAYREFRRQLEQFQQLVRAQDLHAVASAVDIKSAHGAGHTACLLSVEGGDFIEAHLERLNEAREAGVCSITIIHYHVNQIGDTQTESAVHGGLSALGREIIQEMNRLGILVDLSHASEEVVRQAAAIASVPMFFSHSNLGFVGATHPRLIDVETALPIARAGGVVGATTAGFNQSTLNDFIDTIFRMVDRLGVEHVAIGTDMDFTYKPVLEGYRDWSLIPAGLLARGMHEREVAKIMGGNFMRLLESNSAKIRGM
jgi:membrane dipeptidase